jgi:hypothetical protein
MEDDEHRAFEHNLSVSGPEDRRTGEVGGGKRINRVGKGLTRVGTMPAWLDLSTGLDAHDTTMS